MRNGLDSLQDFYGACDRAAPPASIAIPIGFAARWRTTVFATLAPFFGAFAIAAALLTAAAVERESNIPGPIIFPQSAQSAGLSRAESTPDIRPRQGMSEASTWRV